jgi:integrase
MAVRARGGKWQADFMVAGTRYRETFDSEADAIRWEANAKASLMEGKPLPPARNGRAEGKTIATLGALLDYCEKNHWEKLKRSLAVSRINIKQVRTALGDNRLLSEITRSTADELVEFFLERGNTPGTINRKLGILGKALSLGAEIGLNVRHFKMPHLKPGGGRIRVIERHEEPRLLSYFDRINPDMGAFAVLGIETGMRLGELLLLEWTSIADDYSAVRVEKGKTPAARRDIRLTRPARAALVRLRPAHPDDVGPLTWAKGYTTQREVVLGRPYRDLWDRMRNELKMDDVVLHTMRHTCATRLIQSGVQDRIIMKWMGWSSSNMVSRYGHPDDEDLVRAMEKLEDRRPALRVVGS